jgi:CRP/FNR family cyclic AMP-dependent transcriptional regulator
MKGELQVLLPGKMLFREGDNTDGLYFIKEGKVSIFRERDATEIELALLGPGDVLGTVTIISREPRSASARAATQLSVLFVSAASLEASLKTIPVWATALLKDCTTRLKETDAKLCEAIVNEKKLRLRVGTVMHHGAQLAAFLASLTKVGTIEDDGIKLFPLSGFVPRAESVLLQRAEYLQLVLEAFVKGGLIKRVEDKKYGTSVGDPKTGVIDEFSVFCRAAAKEGMSQFAPLKFVPFMSALVRIRKKNPEKEVWGRADLGTALDKDLGRTDGASVVRNLQDIGVVRLKPGSESEYLFDAAQVQRKVIFEATCREIAAIKESIS